MKPRAGSEGGEACPCLCLRARVGFPTTSFCTHHTRGLIPPPVCPEQDLFHKFGKTELQDRKELICFKPLSPGPAAPQLFPAADQVSLPPPRRGFPGDAAAGSHEQVVRVRVNRRVEG